MCQRYHSRKSRSATKTYLPPTQLELSFGLLFKLDDDASRDRHADELMSIEDPTARANKLTDYNVLHGAVSVATSQCVAQAWKFGGSVSVHALVYDLRDGILREIMPAITGPADLEQLLQNSAIAPCTSQWYANG